MKKKLDLPVVIFLLVAAILGTYTISYMFFSNNWFSLRKQNDDSVSKLVEAMEVIESSFVGTYDKEDIVDGAIEGMVTSLNDRWSYYLTAEELNAYYLNLNNQYSGVGIVVEKQQDMEGILIVSVHKNSPAYEAGIMPDSTIVGVDGIDIKDMELSEATAIIKERIEKGSLGLDIIDKNGKLSSVTLIPGVIEVDPVRYKMIEDNIGLITIENFDAKSSSQFISAVETLLDEGAKSFIFDVRNNPGGQLGELLNILDYLLPEGDIFISRAKGEEPRIERSGPECLDMPMAVLVNANSYSAAEFFAAALQEYNWADVIGQKTTGKGYAQVTIKLDDGSAIHISYSEYFTPKGNSLAGIGITPDHQIELDEEKGLLQYYGRLDISEDEQIKKAIKELKTA